jgi:hypothetical protein
VEPDLYRRHDSDFDQYSDTPRSERNTPDSAARLQFSQTDSNSRQSEAIRRRTVMALRLLNNTIGTAVPVTAFSDFLQSNEQTTWSTEVP